jgi:hypothetical protein
MYFAQEQRTAIITNLLALINNLSGDADDRAEALQLKWGEQGGAEACARETPHKHGNDHMQSAVQKRSVRPDVR